MPGGFAWTDPTDKGTCDTHFESDDTFDRDPGNNTPKPCQDVLVNAYDNYPTALIIPVYTDWDKTQDRYTLWQPAAFVLTGWDGLPGLKSRPSLLTGRSDCKTDADPKAKSCIFGYFTTGVTGGSLGSGSGAGVSVVKLTG
jgi:hypothetical protein